MTIIHTALMRAAPRRVEIERGVFVRIEKRVWPFRSEDSGGRGKVSQAPDPWNRL